MAVVAVPLFLVPVLRLLEQQTGLGEEPRKQVLVLWLWEQVLGLQEQEVGAVLVLVLPPLLSLPLVQ